MANDLRFEVARAIIFVPVHIEATNGHDVHIAVIVEVAMANAACVAQIPVQWSCGECSICIVDVRTDIEARSAYRVQVPIIVQVRCHDQRGIVQVGIKARVSGEAT